MHFFHQQGCEVLGVDGSQRAKASSKLDQFHRVHDFVQGPFRSERQFDMVWSCEFVEHVEEQYAGHFLETFSLASRYLLMTYAEPGQPGWHHVNCQPEEYWVEKLDRYGFELHPVFTRLARRATREGHFKHSGLVFRKRQLAQPSAKS